MIRAVVDTNVWVSAALTNDGAPAAVADAFARGDFLVVLPEAVLREIRDVLARDRLRRRTGHTDAQIEAFVSLIATRAQVLPTTG